MYFLIASKKARVTPIPKQVDKCNLSNYEPFSVLPVFSKVFEKVAYTQLCDYLKNNSIMHKQQFGFRDKKSTTQGADAQNNLRHLSEQLLP